MAVDDEVDEIAWLWPCNRPRAGKLFEAPGARDDVGELTALRALLLRETGAPPKERRTELLGHSLTSAC